MHQKKWYKIEYANKRKNIRETEREREREREREAIIAYIKVDLKGHSISLDVGYGCMLLYKKFIKIFHPFIKCKLQNLTSNFSSFNCVLIALKREREKMIYVHFSLKFISIYVCLSVLSKIWVFVCIENR